MNVVEKKEIISALKELERFEYKISKLYLKASRVWGDFREFWIELGRQEIGHSKSIKKTIKIVRQIPDKFIEVKVFNKPNTQIVSKIINETFKKVSKKNISIKSMFIAARDVESSIAESQFNRILDIDKTSISLILETIHAETERHYSLLDDQIKKL